jgi:hypothetical protein
MSCFHDYIGIKGCNSPEGASGLFITQLPGLTLEVIEKMAEKEQVNFMGVWKDVQDRAWLRLSKDFRRQVRKCFEIADDAETDELMCNDQPNFQDVWLYLCGNEMMLERMYSTRLNRYTTIDRPMAAELKDHYQAEYEKALEEAVKSIKIPDDNEDLTNVPAISHREQLP